MSAKVAGPLPREASRVLKASVPMSSSLDAVNQLSEALAGDSRFSAPPWVIAVLGAAIVFSGLAYFVVRARRSVGGPPRPSRRAQKAS